MLPAVNASSPEPVLVRADARVFVLFQAAHAFAKIALREFLAFADVRRDSDRFVVAFLVFSDQHRVTKVRFGLQRNRKSVVCLCWCSFGGWHDHIDRSVRDHKQDNSN